MSNTKYHMAAILQNKQKNPHMQYSGGGGVFHPAICYNLFPWASQCFLSLYDWESTARSPVCITPHGGALPQRFGIETSDFRSNKRLPWRTPPPACSVFGPFGPRVSSRMAPLVFVYRIKPTHLKRTVTAGLNLTTFMASFSVLPLALKTGPEPVVGAQVSNNQLPVLHI